MGTKWWHFLLHFPYPARQSLRTRTHLGHRPRKLRRAAGHAKRAAGRRRRGQRIKHICLTRQRKQRWRKRPPFGGAEDGALEKGVAARRRLRRAAAAASLGVAIAPAEQRSNVLAIGGIKVSGNALLVAGGEHAQAGARDAVGAALDARSRGGRRLERGSALVTLRPPPQQRQRSSQCRSALCGGQHLHCA